MSRTVHCVLLQRDAPGLDRAPYPGALGQRIFEHAFGTGSAKPGEFVEAGRS